MNFPVNLSNYFILSKNSYSTIDPPPTKAYRRRYLVCNDLFNLKRFKEPKNPSNLPVLKFGTLSPITQENHHFEI